MTDHKTSILDKKDKIIFIVGPTAVGKSKVAVLLAKKINAEIISCDSMQIYKGLDVITSKPPITFRKKARHHLIDVINPTKEYNVTRYRQDALKAVREILRKGKSPVFVGGSGLYMSIVIDGIFKGASCDKIIRQRLYKEWECFGSGYLYRRLKTVDPESAKKIHPNDAKRIIRALEVFEITGKPISNLKKQRTGIGNKYDIKIFCLNMAADNLYKRIDERVERMFVRGLENEVKRLLKLKLSKTAQCAIGIKELKGYFNGLYNIVEAKQMIKRNTRLYAKRQLTWFRKDKRIRWIDIDDKEKPEEIVGKILSLVIDK
jgi:tRNA dimethylallyltransferase